MLLIETKQITFASYCLTVCANKMLDNIITAITLKGDCISYFKDEY